MATGSCVWWLLVLLLGFSRQLLPNALPPPPLPVPALQSLKHQSDHSRIHHARITLPRTYVQAGSAIETGELSINTHGWAGKNKDGEKACKFDKRSNDTCEEAAAKSCVIEKGKDGKCKAGTAHWGEVSWTFKTVDV